MVVINTQDLFEDYKRDFAQSILSIKEQLYKNYKIVILVTRNMYQRNIQYFNQYKSDRSIRIYLVENDRSFIREMITILKNEKYDFISFLISGDYLARNALSETRKVIETDQSTDLIYTDQDEYDSKGRRINPWFKPDWSPDLLMTIPYCLHLCWYKKSIMDKIHFNDRVQFDSFMYDLTIKVTEKTQKIAHISKVLYHSKAGRVINNMDERVEILEKTLLRRNISGQIKIDERTNTARILYTMTNKPCVSIVILSKDNMHILKQCVDSIIANSTYENLELLIIDNGSLESTQKAIKQMVNDYNTWERCKLANIDIRYETYLMDFNYSKLCNIGIERTKGEYLIFLNDDIEVITPEWIEVLIGQASIEHVGAVGAKLLYPKTNLIQHVGIINTKSGPTHAFIKERDGATKEQQYHAVTRNYLAVTGACMAISRKKIEEVNGFNEDFPVAFNDVELCFRLTNKGYYNVVRVDIELFHYEAYSRKNDIMKHEKLNKLENDLHSLYGLHPMYKETDPFFNINLNQHRTDFALR